VPFFTSKGKKGSGLGLSLVQSIVERHGGKLEIESEVGKGTSVKLSFVPHRGPLTDEESGPMPEPVAPKKILVIDDELRSRNLIKHMLKSDDHEVYAAGSGKAGLDKLAETKFDLVITDRAMPLMSGDEVARRISEKNPAVRVIMLTGFGDMMKDNEEMPYGVARVMSKPLTQADLRRVMQEIFGSW
jgi:CheY-like chemotaxis protein